jgi:hypothetical protein
MTFRVLFYRAADVAESVDFDPEPELLHLRGHQLGDVPFLAGRLSSPTNLVAKLVSRSSSTSYC